MTTEEIFTQTGHYVPEGGLDYSKKKYDYWEMIDFADLVLKKNQPKDSNLTKHPVSEPLITLMKIVADKTIELIQYDKNDQFAHNLSGEINIAIKSIEAIK